MKQQPIVTHLYEADQAARPNHRGDLPCLYCPLPEQNRVHDLPDTSEAQAEHHRRIGGDQ